MGIGILTDINGKRYIGARLWNNGYKPVYIDEDTGEIASRIDCGGHWLVLNADGVWIVEEKGGESNDRNIT